MFGFNSKETPQVLDKLGRTSNTLPGHEKVKE